jgi:hypothetical protein
MQRADTERRWTFVAKILFREAKCLESLGQREASQEMDRIAGTIVSSLRIFGQRYRQGSKQSPQSDQEQGSTMGSGDLTTGELECWCGCLLCRMWTVSGARCTHAMNG